MEVFVHDPIADAAEALQEYGVELTAWDSLPQADAVVVAVAHEPLLSKPHSSYAGKLKPGGCFIDVKARFDTDRLNSAGFTVWRL